MDGLSAPAAKFVARARALGPLLEAAAPRIERERRFPPDVMDALVKAELFRIALPKSRGGAELDLPGFVAVVEELARADASVAWCVAQGGGCAMAAAYLAPEIAREVYDARDAVVAWGPPLGAGSKAIAVERGYRLTGTWQFASGSPHAAWIGATNCEVYEPDGRPRLDAKGAPVTRRVMLVPKSSVTMIDTWDVMGLKGTGSDNYAVKDLFVPEAYSFVMDSPADRREPGPLYRYPILSLYGYVFAGAALGIARACLDALIRLASEKVPFRATGKLRESATMQLQTALAEARLRAARLLLWDALERSWRDVTASGELALDHRLSLRLASTHVIREAKDVVCVIWEFAGATAIFAENPFERRFRDIHAMTQHMQARFSNYETVGQALLGLNPGPFI